MDGVPEWGDRPEERLLAQETRAHVERAIAALPPGQSLVITLRDVEGCAAPEVWAVLGVTDANQRVLLHRAVARPADHRVVPRGSVTPTMSEPNPTFREFVELVTEYLEGTLPAP